MCVFLQLVDILKGYIDMGVMMQKPNAGGERELQRHYKVCVHTIVGLSTVCVHVNVCVHVYITMHVTIILLTLLARHEIETVIKLPDRWPYAMLESCVPSIIVI